MDADTIIRSFATTGKTLPIEAMLACRDDWAIVAPALLGVLTRYVDGEDRSEDAETALFFILHMLGERGETRAFAPICRLARDTEAVETVLGDGITESLAAILIGTYDGDPGALRNLIGDPKANIYARAEALQAMGFLTASGRIAEDAMAAYLRELHAGVLPQDESYLWYWWAFVIVLLRLDSMGALVEDAFARELIPLEWGDADELREIRDEALGDSDPRASFARERIGPLADAIDTLSSWATFSGDEDTDDDAAGDDHLGRFDSYAEGPAVNPYKDVGRNDPCPCGSGKKFKKCCLGATPA
jgi:uncharacterized protein